MARRSVFIAATGQHKGKTTTCLGLIEGLRKRVSHVGFIKPMGQRHRMVESSTGGVVRVDNDVELMRTWFKLSHLDYSDMSPLVLNATYTRDFLDGQTPPVSSMRNTVRNAFERITSCSDYTIVEGTGHMGVGSIVGLNNATIAKLLGLDVVLVASGGIGSTIDDISLNMQLCQAIGVGVRGVVLNKVHSSKVEMVTKYLTVALREYGVPLLGCIPFDVNLASPSLRHLREALRARPISGEEKYGQLFSHHSLVATTSDVYYELLEEFTESDVLIITPAARCDVINATIVKLADSPNLKAAMVLTGSREPAAEIEDLLKRADVPAIFTPMPAYEAMQRISSFTPKTGPEDVERIDRTVKLVEASIDFDRLLGTPDLYSMACMPDLHVWSSGDLQW